MLGDKNEVPAGSHYMEIRNGEEEKKKKTCTSYRDGEAGFAITCNC